MVTQNWIRNQFLLFGWMDVQYQSQTFQFGVRRICWVLVMSSFSSLNDKAISIELLRALAEEEQATAAARDPNRVVKCLPSEMNKACFWMLIFLNCLFNQCFPWVWFDWSCTNKVLKSCWSRVEKEEKRSNELQEISFVSFLWMYQQETDCWCYSPEKKTARGCQITLNNSAFISSALSIWMIKFDFFWQSFIFWTCDSSMQHRVSIRACVLTITHWIWIENFQLCCNEQSTVGSLVYIKTLQLVLEKLYCWTGQENWKSDRQIFQTSSHAPIFLEKSLKPPTGPNLQPHDQGNPLESCESIPRPKICSV